jgi:hypothetical protein
LHLKDCENLFEKRFPRLPKTFSFRSTLVRQKAVPKRVGRAFWLIELITPKIFQRVFHFRKRKRYAPFSDFHGAFLLLDIF